MGPVEIADEEDVHTMKDKTSKSYWIHALSPLHVGSGRGVGHIDLPIAREKVTNWPYIPGSALKGVIADHHDASAGNGREDCAKKKAAFGTAGDDSSNAGALVFSDARIVCLPVQSLYGTFAWCTSPMVLRQLIRDLEGVSDKISKLNVPSCKDNGFVGKETELGEGQLYLQDLDISVEKNDDAQIWADFLAEQLFPNDKVWKDVFCKRFAVLPDGVFDYLSEMGTQVDARIRIDGSKGVVAKGGLWYEEALPAEAVLAGMVWCDKVRVKGVSEDELVANYCEGKLSLQVGGKATVGRGRISLTFSGK